MVSYSPSGARNPVFSATSSIRSSPETCQPSPARTTSGVSSSCSSRTSPTISSIRSSTVTMPGGAAVLVDHQRRLQAVGADLRHHRVAVQGRGHHRRPGSARSASRVATAASVRHREHLLDVDDADGLVQVAVDDGEAGEPGPAAAAAIRSATVSSASQGLDLGPRRHQLLGGAFAELQRPVHQHGRALVQRAAARRVAHQRHQLLRGARRPQFLGGFDAQPAQDPVRGAVGRR